MKAWLEHHRHSFFQALQRLAAAPLASLVTILVIGIAASLPTSLYVLLSNAERAASGLQDAPGLTVFLKPGTSAETGREIARQLARSSKVTRVRFIDKEEGLRNLQRSGLSDMIAGLDENPLPHAILLIPKSLDLSSLDRLSTELKALPNTDKIAADHEWARRLDAILGFGRDLVWMLATVLGLALAAVTGNTIRLQIFAARQEIEVSRLIGATDRFIRRPFLYFGMLQGLLGGLAAWAIIGLGLWLLGSSVDRLSQAYASSFSLSGLRLPEAAALLGGLAVLGLLGATHAVGPPLR